MSPLAGRKRSWLAGTGSVAASVGLMMVVISPLLVNAAGSDPSRHPTARVLAITFSVLLVLRLGIDVVALLRYPELRLVTDAAGVRRDKIALSAAALSAVVATALWLVTGSGWPFLIFTAVGFVLLHVARPSKHRPG